MSINVTVPAIQGEPAEIYLSEWLVSAGAEVAEGAPLALVEADKAQLEILAPAAGRVLRLDVQPDDQIRVGQVIAVLEPQ